MDAIPAVIILLVWLYGPIKRGVAAQQQIADELRRLRELADRARR